MNSVQLIHSRQIPLQFCFSILQPNMCVSKISSTQIRLVKLKPSLNQEGRLVFETKSNSNKKEFNFVHLTIWANDMIWFQLDSWLDSSHVK